MMTHDEMIAVIALHKSGGKIQYIEKGESRWTDTKLPAWNFRDCDYRIKPEPKLRPWKAEDVPVGAVVRGKAGFSPKCKSLITCVDDRFFHYISENGNQRYEHWLALDHLEHSLDNGKTWLPCGVLEDA